MQPTYLLLPFFPLCPFSQICTQKTCSAQCSHGCHAVSWLSLSRSASGENSGNAFPNRPQGVDTWPSSQHLGQQPHFIATCPFRDRLCVSPSWACRHDGSSLSSVNQKCMLTPIHSFILMVLTNGAQHAASPKRSWIRKCQGRWRTVW